MPRQEQPKAKSAGRFGAADVATYDPAAGMSVRDLIAHGAGKTPGSALSSQDIDAAISKAGVARKDANRIRKAGKHFLETGYDYRLMEDGTFNVFDDKQPLTKAGKKTGDVKGFNPGDLLQMGKNMSTLVGLADTYRESFLKPKEDGDQPWLSTEGSQPKGTAAKRFEDEKFSWETKTDVGKGTGTGTGTGYKPKPTTVSGDNKQPLHMTPNDLINLPKEFKVDDSFFQTNKWMSKETYDYFIQQFSPKLASGSLTMGEKRFSSPNDELLTQPRLDKSRLNKAMELQKTHGRIMKPEQIAAFVNAERQNDVVTGMSIVAGIMTAGIAGGVAHTLLKEAGRNLLLRFGPTVGPRAFMQLEAQLLKNTALQKGAQTAAQAVGTQTVGTAANTATKQTLQLPQRSSIPISKTRQIVSPTTSSGNVITTPYRGPTGQAFEPNNLVGRTQTLGRATQPVSKPVVTYNRMNKNPEKARQALEDLLKWGPQLRKGGKIRAFGGAKLVGDRDPGATKSFEELQTLFDQGFFNPKLQSGLQSNSSSTNPSSVESGVYQKRNSNTGENPFNSESNALNVAGTVAKYALPFIGERLANKRLKDFKPTEYQPVELMTGAVYDMPRPNMNLRYREPTGVDVGTEQAGRKFGDAQERDGRVNYETQNAVSRLGQRQQIVGETNRGKLANAQLRGHYDAMNTQVRAGLAGAEAQGLKEPFVAAQHHLASDLSTDAFIKSSNKAQMAEVILKTKDPTDPVYKMAVMYLGGQDRRN